MKLRVFENKVNVQIKRTAVTGKLRKLHYEELHNLFSLPTTVRFIKSRRMRGQGI
jgi:hypothetical protein